MEILLQDSQNVVTGYSYAATNHHHKYVHINLDVLVGELHDRSCPSGLALKGLA